MKNRLQVRKLLKEGFHLALFGAFAGYIFLAYYIVTHWVTEGLPPNWNAAGNNLGAGLRYISASLFFFPLFGFVAALVGGLFSSLVTNLLGREEEKRRRIGAIVVAVICFAYLGLPMVPAVLFTSLLSILNYVIILLLGALFVWVVWHWKDLSGLLARISGFVLAGSASLWLIFTFFFPRFFAPTDPKGDPPPGPNIVFVLSDAHRADLNSVYGGEVDTPNLERLAGMGVTFERCFAPSSWTVPSVVGMFTGLTPEVSGMDAVREMPAAYDYLPEILSRSGFRTWATFANSTISTRYGMYRGFDYYSNYGRRFFGQGFLEYTWGATYLTWCFRLNHFLFNWFYFYQRKQCPEEGLEMLRALNPEGGDFVYIHLVDAHDPYVPYDRFWEDTGYDGLFERDSREGPLGKHSGDDITPAQTEQLKYLYEGEVRLVDEYMGRVLDTLEDEGLLENTVIIFTADHGEEFNEHGFFLHGEVNLHNELTHVPLLIYWPGYFEGGRRVEQPVSLCDIYPTILDALNLEYEREAINGRSLLEPLPKDRPIFSQRCSQIQDNLRHSDFVVRMLPGEEGTEPVVAALFRNLDTNEKELYLNYYDNPENQIAEYPKLAAELERLLEDWHDRNVELAEYYGTIGLAGYIDPAILENLRGIGYLQ